MMPPKAEVGSVRYAAIVSLERRAGDGHAAGIGVLDDDAGGLVELTHAFDGRVRIGDVVEREVLALQHLRASRRPARAAIGSR